ncbi:MAG: hypothetical protein WBM07_14195 [Chitinivibrionales bacterium]
MRNFMVLILIIASAIVIYLYFARTSSVPTEVKKVLTTEQGKGLDRITQVPDAVRKALEESRKRAQKKTDDALKDIDK